MFGLCFLGSSFPIPSTSFTPVSSTHSALDVSTALGPVSLSKVKDVCLFLNSPNAIASDVALALYIKLGDNEWAYRGCVHAGQPSAAMSLLWPASEEQQSLSLIPSAALIGIALEPLSECLAKEGSALGSREEFAKRVGMDLFRYMESYQTVQMGDQLVVPSNCLDKWFVKFQHRFRTDPDFLTRARDKD
jgi:hypothetical protein